MNKLFELLKDTNKIQRDTPPTCFFCGNNYIKDMKHCSNLHSTWMPNCHCLSKTSIRIVTGGWISKNNTDLMEDIDDAEQYIFTE